MVLKNPIELGDNAKISQDPTIPSYGYHPALSFLRWLYFVAFPLQNRWNMLKLPGLSFFFAIVQGQKNILDFLGEAFFDDWGGGRFAPVYEIRVQLFKRGPVTVFWAGNDCRHPGRRQNKTIEGFISSIISIYIYH